MISPAQVVIARCRAFVAGDFAVVHELHHPESFFRRLYPRREEYVEYGREVLDRDFSIRECRILKEEVGDEEARVIYFLDMLHRGNPLESFEYCHLRRFAGEWRLFSTQKIERADFPAAAETINWDDFERVEDKIVY